MAKKKVSKRKAARKKSVEGNSRAAANQTTGKAEEVSLQLVRVLSRAISQSGLNIMDFGISYDNISGFRFKISLDSTGDEGMVVVHGSMDAGDDEDCISVGFGGRKEFRNCDSEEPTKYFDSLAI